MPQNIVKIDSRKFLGIINDSAQSKVAFYEDKVKEMGTKAGKDWQLVALRANELYFEDTATNQFFIAEHSKKDNSKVTISNIREIQIVDQEKRGLFGESCLKLVEAIETNDQRGMQSAFNRMKSQRFSSRAVPYSGYVKCRDNVRRKIVISNGDSFTEDVRDRLISTIVEGLRTNVILENGHVVSGTFTDGEEFKLPVTKWASRKLVARQMREAAKDAFMSQGFQTRVKQLAGLVAEGNINAAVKAISPFLDEMEEFSLLTREQTLTLVESALAANAIFNDQLINDTATLFHRTNLNVNRRKIIDEWKKIAKVSEHATLAENVQILSESKNFEAAYNKFLKLVFEAISNREVAAEALATTLEVLRNKTPKIRESHDLSSKLDNLISRLKDTNFDDAAIYEAEDLIATIQEELAATETLGNFDQMPSPTGSPDPLGGGQNLSDMGADAGLGGAGGEAGGTPPIVINSPLIQIGGTSGAAGGGGAEDMPMDDLGADPAAAGGDPMGGPEAGGGDELGGDDELEALLGGGGGATAPGGMGGMAAQPPLESRKTRKAVQESDDGEWEKPWLKKDDDDSDDDSDDDDAVEESNDPYAIKSKANVNTAMFMEYGAPAITDQAQLRRILGLMQRLASEHKLTGKALSENITGIAKASINALGLRFSKAKLNKAVEQVTSMFEAKESPFPGASPLFGGGDSEDCDSDDSCDSDSDDSDSGKPWEDDDGVAEDQYHPPRITKRGLAKASINNLTKESRATAKRHIAEGISWHKAQEDACLGEFAGVRFIFDHGGAQANLEPIILSEDGAVEIPIPQHLYNSAFAAAEMTDDDAVPFIEWLYESLEQLRPISDSDDAALAEAMAKITTSPDGSINVEVTDDVGVGDVADGMGAEDGMDDGMGGSDDGMADDGMGAEGGMGGDDMGADDGMAPVDSLDVNGEAGADDGMGGEEMPNYDTEPSMDQNAQQPPAQGAPPAGGQGAPPQQGAPAQGGQGGQQDDPLRFEDEDVTEPKSAKYTKHVKENLRTMPDHKPTGDADDKLQDIGPELKDDDGSGVNPPTAKKMSNS